MTCSMKRLSRCAVVAAALLGVRLAPAATPTPAMQQAARAATFEVVVPKAKADPLSYEKPLPLELIPYVQRTDQYWSIGTAFAIAPNTFVTAGHVLLAATGGQGGGPGLRDADGHVYPIAQVLKFSAHEDFVVFSASGVPAGPVLSTNTEPKMDDVVFAVGNALGEGVVIRDGLLTSQTPEDQDGRWKWLRFSAAASSGNSGGPLLDAGGEVIGVVTAKSPNENLNYALPIALVLDGSSKAAQFNVRYSTRLPNARQTQVATLDTQFDLPKSFADFSKAHKELMLRTTRRDQAALTKALADQLFPKGDSAKLLAQVYDSPLPGFVQQDSTDAWDVVAASDPLTQDLPGKGLVQTGTSLNVHVFRLRRPNGASDATFYDDAAASMDLLLKGLKLMRQVGDQAIRITSLGPVQRQELYLDGYGRRWQVRYWPLGYMEGYLVCYALPVPEGYIGIVQTVPSAQLEIVNEYLKLLAGDIYADYAGSMPQWKSFLARHDLRPSLFDRIKLDVDSQQNLHYDSPRLTLDLPKDLLDTSDRSELVLNMAYMMDGDRLTWDVGGVNLYKDGDRNTYVGVRRHVKPGAEGAKDLLEIWNDMATHAAGFNRVAGHDNEFKSYWIHDAVSAPSADGPGIDPHARVLYDVAYFTDSNRYPVDMEESERRLIAATKILER